MTFRTYDWDQEYPTMHDARKDFCDPTLELGWNLRVEDSYLIIPSYEARVRVYVWNGTDAREMFKKVGELPSN